MHEGEFYRSGYLSYITTGGFYGAGIIRTSTPAAGMVEYLGSRFSLFDFKNIFLLVHMFEQLNLKLGEKLL